MFPLLTFLPNLLYLLATLIHFCIQIFIARVYLKLVFDLILEVCYIIRLILLLFGQLPFEIVKLSLQLFLILFFTQFLWHVIYKLLKLFLMHHNVLYNVILLNQLLRQ